MTTGGGGRAASAGSAIAGTPPTIAAPMWRIWKGPNMSDENERRAAGLSEFAVEVVVGHQRDPNDPDVPEYESAVLHVWADGEDNAKLQALRAVDDDERGALPWEPSVAPPPTMPQTGVVVMSVTRL